MLGLIATGSRIPDFWTSLPFLPHQTSFMSIKSFINRKCWCSAFYQYSPVHTEHCSLEHIEQLVKTGFSYAHFTEVFFKAEEAKTFFSNAGSPHKLSKWLQQRSQLPGWIAWLECCNGKIKTFEEGWAMKMRRGRKVVICVKAQLECTELCLRMDSEPTESSWVKTEEQTGMTDIPVGVC